VAMKGSERCKSNLRTKCRIKRNEIGRVVNFI
jgi:hypothetical protein